MKNSLHSVNQEKYTPAQESTIRKRWLQSYFAKIPLFLVSLIVKVARYPEGFFKYKYSARVGNPMQTTYLIMPLQWNLLRWLFGICLLIALLYPTYYFAYKRRSTKWLLVIIATNVIWFAKNFTLVMKFFREAFQPVPLTNTYAFSLTILLSIYNIALLLVSGYFILTSSRLYRLNATLKKTK